MSGARTAQEWPQHPGRLPARGEQDDTEQPHNQQPTRITANAVQEQLERRKASQAVARRR